MNTLDFDTFRSQALAAGYDDVLVREWAPGLVVDTHTHPFSVNARVVRGGVVLTCGGEQKKLTAGDSFSLTFDEPHAEHYGPEGATFWVARRNAAA